MSDYNRGGVYKKTLEILLTDKQYRYLEALNLLKNKNGLSEVVRDIIEEYRRNHPI